MCAVPADADADTERLEDGATLPRLLRELLAVEYGTGGFG